MRITRVLVVDDLRQFVFPSNWSITYARSLADAAYLLSTHYYDAVYLDHDMGPEEARHLVTWLQARFTAGKKVEIGDIFLQTSNSVEKLNMPLTLERCGYRVRQGLGRATLDVNETSQRAQIAEELEAARFPYGRQ